MRRGRKASIPVSSVPALRRRAALAKEPEVSVFNSFSLGSSASAANLQGDPLQLPESWSRPGGAQEPLSSSDWDCALQADPQELPPPPPAPAHLSPDGGHGAQGSVLQPDIMLNIFRSIPTQMDYKGQKLAEQIFQGIILFSAVIGFIYGYITEQFGWTVYIVMAGFALSCMLTLPPWPIYRRNPLKWLPVQESATDDKKPTDKKVKRHPKN
ncbi:signal peptidase complex subunit 1 isoform X2 [Varanus komodoensis]|uniref:signal peptidase complex subunit 1 isoform X2 n=1 Tax=Varanus komodoensis TaxID=61221 RepID=UPI001CF7C4CF|nr:signal peptidase complex subunit 1 isoform X2 [Varanus komodoensis]